MLRDTGEEVAVKVQRPGVEPLIFRDIFIFRTLGTFINGWWAPPALPTASCQLPVANCDQLPNNTLCRPLPLARDVLEASRWPFLSLSSGSDLPGSLRRLGCTAQPNVQIRHSCLIAVPAGPCAAWGATRS